MLKETLARLVAREDLKDAEAYAAMAEIMDGAATPAQIAGFATALRMKGETVEEITGCARAMRERVIRIDAGDGVVLDTCGTGGDGKGTFNISTISAFVVAACGVKVAKHGNRAASSKCGSADLLEALGVKIENPKEKVEQILRDVGIAYLHAPALHPAMKHAAPVRKELGFRTIFNLLGPLCNPAFANVQTIGIFNPKLARPFAEVLRALGSRAAFTFHGHGGLDELSTTGDNEAFELRDGKISKRTISASSAGLRKAKIDDLAGGTVEENVRIARDIFDGKDGPRRDAVLLNAAIALVAGGSVRSPREGAKRAADALDTGLAKRKLEQLIQASQ